MVAKKKLLSSALSTVCGAAGGAIALGLLTAVPAQSAFAASVTDTACAAPWGAATVYNGGATASEDGVNYNANWWTLGDDPATHSGSGGSGQPWTAQGACSGGAPPPPSTPPPPPTTPPAPPPTTPPAPPPTTPPPAPPSPPSAPAPSGCTVWTEGGTYTANQAVSYQDQSYTARVNQTDWAGTGWNPASAPALWAPGGNCGTPTPPAPPPSTPPAPPPTTPPAPPPPVPPPGAPPVGGTGPNLLFTPYKDVIQGINLNNYAIGTAAATGSPIPIVGVGSLYSNYLPKLPAITLAFVIGECGNGNWGGIPGATFASDNVTNLDQGGLNYIVGTGGAGGNFTCATPAAFVSFINRYYTPHMIGVDFDIEYGQNQSIINNLVADVAVAEVQFPNMRFSFTVATLGASDGSHANVNAMGDMVVKAVMAGNLKNYTINLMTMDYGSASAKVCVVVNGVCDMGQTAVQAAKNLAYTYGVPLDHIELTPMIGDNDSAGETFTLADMNTVMQYATANDLAGVHIWSLDRDTPCGGIAAVGGIHVAASPTCSSGSGAGRLAFDKAAISALDK